MAAKIIVNFGDFFLPQKSLKMRDVLEKMWECGKLPNLRDFPHDCGMVDTYDFFILCVRIRTRVMSTSRVPFEGKSSTCLICMKYRIIILIIIIISLGQILLSYIANTSCTHARARTHTPSRCRTGYRFSLVPNRDGPLRCHSWPLPGSFK